MGALKLIMKIHFSILCKVCLVQVLISGLLNPNGLAGGCLKNYINSLSMICLRRFLKK